MESANYTMGKFEHEYIPMLIGLMCDTWPTLQEKHCTDGRDLEVCLRVIVDALRFAGASGGR